MSMYGVNYSNYPIFFIYYYSIVINNSSAGLFHHVYPANSEVMKPPAIIYTRFYEPS